MTTYSPQIALTARLLQAKGQLVIARKRVDEDYDKLTDLPAGNDPMEQTVAALISAPSTMTEQAYANQFKAGTMVLSRTRNFLLAGVDTAGNPVQLEAGDELTFGGFTWTIAGISATEPDGTPILFKGTIKR